MEDTKIVSTTEVRNLYLNYEISVSKNKNIKYCIPLALRRDFVPNLSKSYILELLCNLLTIVFIYF